MSHCKLRTTWPIHFKLRTVIGIDSLYWFLKKCWFQLYKCSNSCLWCSCWWNLDFSFKSYGKESLYKYCMNVDDGRIMRFWRSCLFTHTLKLSNQNSLLFGYHVLIGLSLEHCTKIILETNMIVRPGLKLLENGK